MNDEHYLLASAYTDGELTAAERLLAEADPDVMSEVDQLIALQTRMRSVDRPSDAARDAAIGAAMAAFTAAATRPAPPINAVTRTVEFRRRPSYFRYLGLAAAVVAVGLLGLVVATGLRSGDDDDSSATEPAFDVADESADEPAAESSDRALTESAEADLAEPAADGSSAAQVAPAEELATADAAATEPVEEPAAEPADDAGSAPPTAPVAVDLAAPLTTTDQLGAYGAWLLELRAASSLPPTPETVCPQPGIMSRTDYVLDGLAIEVLIAVDESERTVTAIDPGTCEALAVGPLF